MSYNATTDFLALERLTSGGVRTERMPGLDYLVVALARMGVFQLSVSATAPTTNQLTTAWFKPATPSWAYEGTLFLWNGATNQYEFATPILWSSLLLASAVPPSLVQDITTPGPVNVLVGAGIVRVNQAVSAPITLVMPLAASKIGPVLISDWKGDAGTNNITITPTGLDKFPGGALTWQIAADTGSVNLRPVTGGYVL